MDLNALIVNGTGTVGAAVVQEMLAIGASVSITTRGGKPVDKQNIRAFTGTLLEPDGLRPAFEQADVVYLLNAPGETEAFEGLAAVMLAKQAGVRRIVYQSTHKADLTSGIPIGGGTKIAIENAIRESGMEYTILRPNWFMQNDMWFIEAIWREGFYPAPLGSAGISRVDIRDIAEIARLTLTENGHDGQTYNIVGPNPETGQSCAACWERSLSRPVVYDEPRAFAESAKNHTFSPGLAFAYRAFFEFYHQHGMRAEGDDLAVTSQLLGRAPRSMQDFTDEVATSLINDPA